MGVTRITGMVSGMDTDQVVKDLMKIEKMRIDNVEKEKTRLEWTQEAYRDVIKKMDDFQNKYFDVLKPKSNFATGSAFSSFSESVTLGGASSSLVAAHGSTQMNSSAHSIQSIEQMATADSWRGTKLGLGKIKSANPFAGQSIPENASFNLSIDGISKKIEFNTSGISNVQQLTDVLNQKIQEKFGSDYNDVVKVVADSVELSKAGSKISVLSTSDSPETLTWLGIDSGAATDDYKTKSIKDLLGITNDQMAEMKVNGASLVDMGLNEDSSLDRLSSVITSFAKANVQFGYDSASDSFTISSDKTGTANLIQMNDEFKNAFGFDASATHTEAKNAILTVDGTRIVKQSNKFKLDGIGYDIKGTYDGSNGDIKININKNVDKIKDQIMDFVKDYNKMVGDFKKQLSQKKAYDFNPLTKEEREAMTDDEIEKWEKKAKSGLLKNDRAIQTVLTGMREALYTPVEGVNLRIFDIGIQTSSDVKTKAGQLVVDENKLKEALENNYDQVVKLFSSSSDKKYKDVSTRKERYRESGIGSRINDVIKDAIRKTRDSTGKKGSLVEKAGLKNDVTAVTSELAKQMRTHKLKMNKLWDAYYKKEAQYYNMFAKMEVALEQMQNQGMSFMSQMGM